ncbi:MAG: hypothetical protein M3P26_15485 [Gemmatimonadota bacterium]|nr:hypothetical protein [Gemmatimonadota bacterium]
MSRYEAYVEYDRADERRVLLEAITLVCDVCGKPAVATVTIKVGNKNHLKDFCSQHLGELLQNARTPKRGRPRVSATTTSKSPTSKSPRTASTSRGRRKRIGAAKTTRKPRGAKTATSGVRRGRPRKRQSAN